MIVNKEKPELKDCPFCGSNKKSVIVYMGKIICPDCSTEIIFPGVTTITETVAMWNTRTSVPLTNAVSEIKL